MQGRGVRYHVKHSGEFLYKISNEEDLDRFKITKIKMPSQIKQPRVQIEASPLQKDDHSEVTVSLNADISSRLGKTNEIAPLSDFLGERENFLLPMTSDQPNSLTGLKEAVTIYEAEDGENVLEFEVFKNYLAMVVEKNG